MSSGLGQTTDPAALIPGDPASLEQAAQQFAIWAGALKLAADGLGRIDTTSGWSGQAADQFRLVFDHQPGKWLRAADAFENAAGALAGYAEVLSWAQGQAAAAIIVWGTGADDHQAAGQVLDGARSRLAAAASAAAQVIGRARDMAPPKPGLLAEIGQDVDGALDSAWHGILRVGEDGFDVVASMGNAAVDDPGAALASFGGMLLTGVSAGGEGLGLVLDATGIGAVAGVPLDVASAAGMAAGAGITGTALARMTADAAGPDRVSMAQSNGGGATSGGTGDPNFDELKPAEQDTLIRLQEKDPDMRAGPRGPQGQDLGYEYVDGEGRTYDQMGNPNTSRFWGAQRTKFFDQIDRHLLKSVNYVVIDMTGFTQQQAEEVAQYIDSLPETGQARIIKVGF